MAKIDRIHQERRVPQKVELREDQEVTEKMDHRAWVQLSFTCPYCQETETLSGDMLLPVRGGQDYTIVTKHICKQAR